MNKYRGWKKDARELCRAIASTTPDGPVTGAGGEFLASLLAEHPDAAEKIGPGIAYICVGPVPGHRTRGFTVHRTDGTSTDFAWTECITLVPGRDGLIGRPMTPDFEKIWVSYHQREAQLRILSKTAHKEVTQQQQRGRHSR